MLFFVYSMMISGAGSTFEEYYGVDGNIGRAIMIIASLGTVLLGARQAGQNRRLYCTGSAGRNHGHRRTVYR